MARIGILGAADPTVGRYINALRGAAVDVVGLFDSDAHWGAQVGGHNAVAVFPTAESLVDTVEAVVICAEKAAHRALVEIASAAGVSILCGNPAAVSAAESQLIMDLCRRQDVTLMPAFPLRFDPAVRRIRDLAVNGDLGVLRCLSGSVGARKRCGRTGTSTVSRPAGER